MLCAPAAGARFTIVGEGFRRKGPVMRRWFITTAAAATLLSGMGCHGRLFRRPCTDDCPTGSSGGSGRSGGGRLELGDPVPGSGSRLPPADVPLGDYPTPRLPDTRNSPGPFGPEGRRYQPEPRRQPPADIPLLQSQPNRLDDPVGAPVAPRDAVGVEGGLPPRVAGR